MFTLAELAQSFVEVFGPAVLVWCALFLIACTVLAIFMALVALAMSRT
jgi:hypothetical protein